MAFDSTPRLFGARNHVSTEVAPCLPWEYTPNVPPEALETKGKFVEWGQQPSTDHLFFTGTEGRAQNIRASKQNIPYRLHAFIADYDSPNISEAMIANVLKESSADYPPNYMARTYSGGVRLVWLFEESIAVDTPKLAAELLRLAMKELRAECILPRLDKNAWADLYKLYEVGTGWQKLSDKRISKNMLHYWSTRAWNRLERKHLDGIAIPLEIVAQEAERRFPGRWEGPFELGKRGVVFFREDSTNPTAAQVAETGMLCFSTEKSFYPWAEIFGLGFVEQYQADKIGAAVSEVYMVGGNYYRKNAQGFWVPYRKEDFKEWLEVRHGIETTKGKGDVTTEMKRTLVYLQDHRRLEGGIPAIYNRSDVITVNGRRMLNTAMVKVMVPVDEAQEWGINFPWLAGFHEGRFDSPEQHELYQAWFRRFYRSAYEGNLVKGQTLFLAGGVGKGKTLLGTKIIGAAMGGYADACDYLNSATSFNKELMEVAVWTIDDGVAAQDPKAHQKFSEMIKRITANAGFQYHPKYVDPVMMPWMGRVIITLNDDASSLRILPNLDESIKDKIIVLRFSDNPTVFPPSHELDQIITRELPYYLRWVLDSESPAEVMGDARYGVKSYIHEGIREQALFAGEFGDILEIIRTWIKICNPFEVHGDTWTGSAADFMAELSNEDSIRPLVSKLSTRALGHKFRDAAQVNDSFITKAAQTKHRGSGLRYTIDLRGIAGDGPV